jgi:peptidyl-dipeptidase Dcp
MSAIWEVTERDGRHIGLFLGDYFARASKRSGAWMSAYRGQESSAARSARSSSTS